MKNLVGNLLVFAFIFISSSAYSKTYTWKPSAQNQLITKVTLSNGATIKLTSACKSGDEKCKEHSCDSYRQIIGITADNQNQTTILSYDAFEGIEDSEDIVAIETYFGDKESRQQSLFLNVATINTNCATELVPT